MPVTKSAIKQLRKSKKRYLRNKRVKNSIRTCKKYLLKAIQDRNFSQIEILFPRYCSLLDKGVKKGVIKLNTASRYKSRMHKKIESIKKES